MIDAPRPSRLIRDLVILALWLPVILVLLGVGIGVAGLGVRTALYGELPNVGGLAGAINPTLAVVAVSGAIGYLYLTLATATFGEETVDSATEQASEIADEVRDD